MKIFQWMKSISKKLVGKVSYPQDIHSFFNSRRCPDCGNKKFNFRQDGGHDICLQCAKCKSEFGIQEAPFKIIERIGKSR